MRCARLRLGVGLPHHTPGPRSSTGAAGGDFAVSQAGTFVYVAGIGTYEKWSIVWLNSKGKTQPLFAAPGIYSFPRFSPDGKRLAFSMGGGTGEDIWVKDLASRTREAPLSFRETVAGRMIVLFFTTESPRARRFH